MCVVSSNDLSIFFHTFKRVVTVLTVDVLIIHWPTYNSVTARQSLLDFKLLSFPAEITPPPFQGLHGLFPPHPYLTSHEAFAIPSPLLGCPALSCICRIVL